MCKFKRQSETGKKKHSHGIFCSWGPPEKKATQALPRRRLRPPNSSSQPILSIFVNPNLLKFNSRQYQPPRGLIHYQSPLDFCKPLIALETDTGTHCRIYRRKALGRNPNRRPKVKEGSWNKQLKVIPSFSGKEQKTIMCFPSPAGLSKFAGPTTIVLNELSTDQIHPAGSDRAHSPREAATSIYRCKHKQ